MTTRAALGLLVAGLVAGCAAVTPAPAVPRVADDVRAARLALGPVDDVLVPAEDPRPRLRALRDLADRLGNRGEAGAAAVAVVELSRQRVAIAHQRGGDVATARRELDADRQAALTLVMRTRQFWTLDRILDGLPAGDPLQGALVRVVEARGWLGEASLERARTVARTPREQALIQRASRQRPTLALDVLAALGPEFLDLLERLMINQLDDELVAPAVVTARAIVAVDPLHVDARLLIAYDDDRRAGHLTAEAVVARALVGPPSSWQDDRFAPTRAVAVLDQAQRDFPRATSLGLGLAWALVEAEMPGDAASRLDEVPAGESPASRQLRDDLRGLVALDAGAGAAYRSWRTRRGGERSPFVADLELRFQWMEVAPMAEAMADEAARRIVAGNWPMLRRGLSEASHRVAADPAAPRALRERAIERSGSEPARAVYRHCVRERLPRLSCQRLHDAFVEVDSDEPSDIVGAVAQLVAVPATAELWVNTLSWAEPEELRAVWPHLAALEGTGPGLTEAWTNTAIRAAVARGDAVETRRLLATYGGLLTPIASAGVHLAIADLAAGHDADLASSALVALASATWPMAVVPRADTDLGPDNGDADDGEAEPALPTGDAELFAHAVQRPYAAGTAAIVRGLRDRYPGSEAAALDVVIALAGATADDAATAGQPLPADAPEADLVAAMLGRRDAAIAPAALARYLARRVGDDWARAAHTVARLPDAAAAADRDDDASMIAPRDRDDLADAVAAGHDPWRLVGTARRFGSHRFAHSALAQLEAAVDEASEGDIRGRAAAALALARRGPIGDRSSVAWLALLAGDVAAARAIAEMAVPAAAAEPWPQEPPLGPAHPVSRLLADRAQLPDELVREVWRLRERGDDERLGEIIERLLDHPAAGHGSNALACRSLIDADQADAAVAPCWTAWRGGPHDEDLAVALTWVVINRPDQTADRGIDGAALVAEVETWLAGNDSGAVANNLASWYERRGDTRRSEELAALADRAGWDRQDQAVLYAAMASRRATTLRTVGGQRLGGDQAAMLERGQIALAAGDLPAARWYVAAAAGRLRAEDAEASPMAEETFVDVLALATSDVASGAMSAEAAGAWFRAFLDTLALAPELVADHPRSALIALTVASDVDHAERVAAAERLIRDFPHNRLAVMQSTRTLALAGRRDEAARALAVVRARHPDSVLVASTTLAGGRAGGDWLASPAAFAAAVAATTPAEVAALDPVRVVVGAAETFVPRKKLGEGNIFDLELGGRVGLYEVANPTRCTGAACLDAALPEYPPDWKPRWRRDDLVLFGKPGAQVLFDAPVGSVLVSLVASGGRLFQIVTVLPTDRPEALRPVIRLMHDALRPLDLVVPADRAEALRDGLTLPADHVRLSARRGVAAKGCDWIPASLDEQQRGGLLVDVALLDAALLPRAVACADLGLASGDLAALALIGEDPAATGFGRKVAADRGFEIIDAGRILFAAGQTQTSLDLAPGQERPRRGWLELAAALPDAAREHAVTVLLASTVSSERAAGLLIAGLVPTPVTRRRLRDELALAPAGFAQLAVEAMPRPLEAADLAALRRRADRVPGAAIDAPQRRLLASLAEALESAGDPADRKRLLGIARMLGRDVPTAAPSPSPPPAGGGVALSDTDLTTLALPRLLDGDDWTYGRAPQPAALFASASELIARLRVDGVTQEYVLRSVIDALRGPMALLGKHGGLDLTRTIECASHGDDFVCTATLADPAAFERTLAAWPESLNSIRVADLAPISGGLFSMFAGGAPLLAERVFDPPQPDGGDDGLGLLGSGTAGRRLVHERLRLSSTVAGRTLVRHLVVSAGDDGRSEVKGPGVVVVGNRLFVFGSPTMARRVLLDLPAAGSALADDTAFRTATAGWVDGVALYGVVLRPGGDHAGFAMVPEADGLRFRIRNVDKKPTPPARAVALLPPGASSLLATSASRDEASRDSVGEVLGPRQWLMQNRDDLAFGWYSPAGGRPDGWVVVVRWDRALEKSAAAHGLGKLGRRVREARGLHGARHGDYLVVGSRADLVTASLARRLGPPARDGHNWVSRFDGVALAAALRARPTTSPEQVNTVMIAAMGAELAGSVEASSRRVGDADVMEGVIRPRLAAADDTRAVIDRWLTTPQLRNTTRLPRELTPTEVERPLAFVIELADAGAVATRLFPATPRTRVELLDAQRVRVVVTPAPALADAVAAMPIDDAARKRALADGTDVRTSHTRIKQLARDLVPAQSRPADAAVQIGTWVHQHLTYQVTASGGDAVDILERGSGDCTEYSLLTVSLLRAAGVPAETRFGVAAGGGELVAHAWVAFHDGTAWREIDPTWGRTSVGADHIETSIMDFVALVSLDKLTITAIETATAATAP